MPFKNILSHQPPPKRYQPKANKPSEKLTQGVDSRVLFGVAAYADRMNRGEYVKQDITAHHDAWNNCDVAERVANRTHAKNALRHRHLITVEDYANGETVRNYFKGLAFKAIAGKLDPFEKSVFRVVEMDDFSNDDQFYLHLGLVCSLFASHRRAVKTDEIEFKTHRSKHLGEPGQKIELDVRVLRSIYSQQWGRFFITAETDGGNIVFFSVAVSADDGEEFHIAGKVKRHVENGQTQLHYVRIKGHTKVGSK